MSSIEESKNALHGKEVERIAQPDGATGKCVCRQIEGTPQWLSTLVFLNGAFLC
jgi:hypothetical protein